MTEQLRRGLVAKAPEVELTGEVEPDARASSGIDEVYVVPGQHHLAAIPRMEMPLCGIKAGQVDEMPGYALHR